jgi:deoxyribodipyrimidine photolyase-related protein
VSRNQSTKTRVRHLVIVLGDQLDTGSAAFDDYDAEHDAVLMAELEDEASFVPQHKKRLVLFFSAMRHFRDEMKARDFRVHYVTLDDPLNRHSFEEETVRWANKTHPEKIIVVKPGDHRVEQALRNAGRRVSCPVEIRSDRHFLISPEQFAEFADGRGSLMMETFYRYMRREHDVLMRDRKPIGGRWNFDSDNRQSLKMRRPESFPAPRAFKPDRITRDVMELVSRRFPEGPGKLDGFDYPVTADEAKSALDDFISHRLCDFGTYQDAMVTSEPYLFHSRLSCVLNLHLLDPRAAIETAVAAYENGDAAINSVEGFIRQIMGWREYVRGIYWLEMPEYAEMNALAAELPMPRYMWTGETDMNCVHQSVDQLVEHGYAHHIQRLMVLGLHALLLGVNPVEVNRWHMSMYTDAVDWVSLPNVLGMSQFGDGGIVGTKPYAASGGYINRMSDYCRNCRYDPMRATGDDACPFTTLYWDFLSRNRNRLQGNQRMQLQFKNLDRKSRSERREIKVEAGKLKTTLTKESYWK